MKKTLWMALLLCVSKIILADENADLLKAKNLTKDLFSKSRVKILPISEMNIPKSDKKDMLHDIETQRVKGFIEDKSTDAKQLLHMGLMSNRKKMNVDSNNSDPHDTHLKKNLSQIKLAFPFKGVPSIESKDVIGFAASGTWKNGWTGVRELFNKKNVGTCDFTVFNLALSNGGQLISAENVRYDVNSKPTIINILGSKEGGFTYRMLWADNNFSYNLDCANENFDQKITDDLILLAQAIDNSMNTN